MPIRTPRPADTLVYLGTIDDVVLRHPWQDIPIGENFLIETIVDHVLFGMPLLINDGYLVNHPLARADLIKGKDSLILALVKKGFIKVLTRVDDLSKIADMPIDMARDIGSFDALVRSSDWATLRNRLSELADTLSPDRNVYGWPPVDMGDGYRILLENVLSGIATKGYETLGFRTSDQASVQRVLSDVVNELIANTAAARTKFEDRTVEMAKSMPNDAGLQFVSDLMGLANEAYHFNFGIALDHQLSANGLNVVTETRFSRAFDDLLAIEEKYVSLTGDMPLMGKPDFKMLLDPAALVDIVDPATDIGGAKLLFQQRMRDFATGGRYSAEEARAFADLYERALARHFAPRRKWRGTSIAVNLGVNLTTSVMGAYFAPVKAMADAAGEFSSSFGMGLLSSYVGERNILRVGHRLRVRAMQKQLDSNRAEIKPNVQRAMLSALRFDTAATLPIAQKVKRF